MVQRKLVPNVGTIKILVHSLVVADSSLKLLILYGNLRQPIKNLQLQVSRSENSRIGQGGFFCVKSRTNKLFTCQNCR